MTDAQKKKYGRADRGIQDILNEVVLKDSRDTLQKFVNERKANGAELKPLACKLYTYKIIANKLRKPIKNVSKDDLVALLSNDGFNTIYYKKLIKQLYKWLNKHELISWIKLKKSTEEIKKTRPKITITEEHAAKFLAACDNIQDRALFEVFADKNAPKRPKDFENIRVKHVNVNDLGVTLHFTSKTQAGDRDVYLQNSRLAFLKFWEHHPFKDQLERPVFYNVNKSNYGKPLMYEGIKGRFKQILKRADIPRELKEHFTLYTFRRTVATWMLSDPDYTPQEVKVMGGWSSIRMLDIYGKITDKMVNLKSQVLEAKKDQELAGKLLEESKKDKMLAKLMAKHGLIKDEATKEILGSKVCPRCSTENLFSSESCSKCWLPLNKKGLQSIERDKDIIKLLLSVMGKNKTIKAAAASEISADPKIKEQFEKLVKGYV